MNVDFRGFCSNTKSDIASLARTAVDALTEKIEALDKEDDAAEIQRLEEQREECRYEKKRAFSYIDSIHNVLLELFGQKTDAETLRKIKDAKDFLCFSEEWQPKTDCIITLEAKQ